MSINTLEALSPKPAQLKARRPIGQKDTTSIPASWAMLGSSCVDLVEYGAPSLLKLDPRSKAPV